MTTWHQYFKNKVQKSKAAKDRVINKMVLKLNQNITPNFLTYTRLILAIALFFLFLIQANNLFYWALTFFIIGKITDLFDGAIARARGLESKWGGFIDTVSDKLLYIAIFLALHSLWPFIAFIFIVYGQALVIILIIINELLNFISIKFGQNFKLFRLGLEIIFLLIGLAIYITELIL